MNSVIKSIISGILPVLVVSLLVFGYIRGCAPRHTMILGPVAQAVIKEGRITTPEQAQANSESMIEFVHDMLSTQMSEFPISKDRLSLLKGSNGHFRIMGGFDLKKDETVLFVIVLKDGKEIYREIGKDVITGHYPQDVFPTGMYFRNER